MLVHCSTQHPSEMQHLVAHALKLHAHHVQVECRRMGGGFGGKESQSGLFACVAAVAARKLNRPVKLRLGPRRRLPHHRPAPLLLVRVRGGLRRRRPRARRRGDDGVARRPFGRPVGPGDDARAVPLRQRLLAARRGHARLLGQDQHAEQHRVPRLRRAAGRDRDREHPRQHRAHARQGPAGRAARSTSTARAQSHALRPEGRRQRHPRAGGRTRGEQRLPRAARPRSRSSTRPARCSSAAWR